jgi:hypothetical protein
MIPMEVEEYEDRRMQGLYIHYEVEFDNFLFIIR